MRLRHPVRFVLVPAVALMILSVGALATSIGSTQALAATGQSTSPAVQQLLIGETNGYTFPQDIDSYTAIAGALPHFVMWFQSWHEPLFYSGQQRGIDARNVTPIITWSPGSDFSMSRMVAGAYDSYITAQAKLAKSWKRPIFIRPFHEMNGTWVSYGPDKVSSQTFVAGWRHVVDIFRRLGVSNVTWVWSPNVYGSAPNQKSRAFDSLYPGNAYVDWVGLDGYNYGHPWMSWASLYSSSYADLAALSPKPMMVAEWGSTATGGDEAAWIRDAFLTEIPTDMPRIRAAVSFDRVAESDFRINSSTAVLAAYRAVIARK